MVDIDLLYDISTLSPVGRIFFTVHIFSLVYSLVSTHLIRILFTCSTPTIFCAFMNQTKSATSMELFYFFGSFPISTFHRCLPLSYKFSMNFFLLFLFVPSCEGSCLALISYHLNLKVFVFLGRYPFSHLPFNVGVLLMSGRPIPAFFTTILL